MLPVRISDIGLYLRCPRLVYFDAMAGLPRKLSTAHLLLRSLMLSLSSCDGLEDQLRIALAKLEHELPLIYGEEIDANELLAISAEIEAILPIMIQELALTIDWIFPSEVEVDLRSDRLALSGRLDRLVTEGHIPSIIKTGWPPKEGAWKRDRIQLAGYALLIGEEYGQRIDLGLVEYARTGTVRKVQIHSVDRSRVLRIRDRIQQIREGRLPDRLDDGRCEGCEVRCKCETRVSLASRFF